MAFFHGCKVQNEKTSFRGTLYGKEGNRQRFSVQEKKIVQGFGHICVQIC